MIKAYVATDEKGGVAVGNVIPWDIQDDRTRLWGLIMRECDALVITRTCREGIPRPQLPLPTYVWTTHPDMPLAPNEQTFSDIKQFVKDTEHLNVANLGGPALYGALMPHTSVIDVSYIEHDYGCDRFMPEIPLGEFNNPIEIAAPRSAWDASLGQAVTIRQLQYDRLVK